MLTLSKRDDSVASNDYQPQSLTIKQSQITKALQGKELLSLYEKLDRQRLVLNEAKQVLGDPLMTDQCIVERIACLMKSQRVLRAEHSLTVAQMAERHDMQIEDVSG